MTVKIDGMDAAMRMLKDLLPKEAKKLMRDTVQDVAVAVVNDAKPRMPVDSGDMVAGTYARREPVNGSAIKSTVRVRNAFYWRFQEYGQGPDHVEHAMFFKAKEKIQSRLDEVALDAFAKRIVARLMRR